MIYHSISDYLSALNIYNQTPAVIKSGKMFIRLDGKLISYDEYQKSNSKPTYEPELKSNPDSTQIASGTRVKQGR